MFLMNVPRTKKDVMKNILIRNIRAACAVMLIGLLPYSVTTANASEDLLKTEAPANAGKDDGVKSMLLIAAENGDMKAQTLYIQQNTQPKTQTSKPIVDLAKTWARAGNISLMVWLGDNFYTGNQLPQELQNAGYWYSKATENGDINARYNLAYMYFHGQGIKKNPNYAQELLTVSANKNHALSIDLLKKVNVIIAELKEEWEGIIEEKRQAQMEFDRLTEQLRKDKLAVEKSKQTVKSSLEDSQKKLKLLEEKLAISKAKEKEVKLVNTLLAKNNKFNAGAAFKFINKTDLRTDKIRVTEYFSYNCEGCNLLQKNGRFDKWANAQNADIEVNKVHITGMSKVLARLFYTLKEMEVDKSIHKDVFKQISLNQPIYTKEDGFLKFISSQGIDTKTFKEIYSSPEIDKKMEATSEHVKTLGLKRIPAFVVNGQYYVTPATAIDDKPYLSADLSKDERSRQTELRLFAVIDFLVGIERGVIKNK